MPIIEDHDESVELGEWVIEDALNQIRIWRKMGIDLVISVNISARQILQADFVNKLSNILNRYPDVPAESIEEESLDWQVPSKGMLSRKEWKNPSWVKSSFDWGAQRHKDMPSQDQCLPKISFLG